MLCELIGKARGLGARFILGASIAAVGAIGSAHAVSIADIQDEQFSTIFNDTGSNAVAGEVYAPSVDQNPIGQIADFGDVGRVAFIQSPPYYLVNPNAWAFSGPETAVIEFNEAIKSVSLIARGTEAGDSAGPNGIFPFTAADGSFGESDAFVSALDINGNVINGSQTAILNLDMQGSDLVDEITFTNADLGEDIYGLAFTQTSTDPNVGVFVGGLGITPVPEPGPLGLIAAAGLFVFTCRRKLRAA